MKNYINNIKQEIKQEFLEYALEDESQEEKERFKKKLSLRIYSEYWIELESKGFTKDNIEKMKAIQGEIVKLHINLDEVEKCIEVSFYLYELTSKFYLDNKSA